MSGLLSKIISDKKKVFLISYNSVFIFVKRTTSYFKLSHQYNYILKMSGFEITNFIAREPTYQLCQLVKYNRIVSGPVTKNIQNSYTIYGIYQIPGEKIVCCSSLNSIMKFSEARHRERVW